MWVVCKSTVKVKKKFNFLPWSLVKKSEGSIKLTESGVGSNHHPSFLFERTLGKPQIKKVLFFSGPATKWGGGAGAGQATKKKEHF